MAWVYEKAKTNNDMIKQISTPNNFGKIEGETTAGFKILLEIDINGNIMNAYPKI